MPRISEFYGIIIGMYYDDHGVAHFHATYAEFEASISISPVGVIDGDLPNRAQRMVLEWAALRQTELAANWERARARRPLLRIDPLD
jgi:hypothetical protein